MKNLNKGFTMSEILITLGIIGIVSAIALPAINSLMPDKNKIMYLKAYDSLASTVRDLAYNTTFFSPAYDHGVDATTGEHIISDISKATLANSSDVKNSNGDTIIDANVMNDTFKSTDKLCKVLASTFNILGNEACSVDTQFPAGSPSFITQNGMQWWVTTPMSLVRKPTVMTDRMYQEVLYLSIIYVDIDPAENSSNCIITDEVCENKVPDRFCFAVFAGGDVHPADSYGKEYLKNRMSTRYKKIEIENPVLEDNVNAYKEDDIHIQTWTYFDDAEEGN